MGYQTHGSWPVGCQLLRVGDAAFGERAAGGTARIPGGHRVSRDHDLASGRDGSFPGRWVGRIRASTAGAPGRAGVGWWPVGVGGGIGALRLWLVVVEVVRWTMSRS